MGSEISDPIDALILVDEEEAKCVITMFDGQDGCPVYCDRGGGDRRLLLPYSRSRRVPQSGCSSLRRPLSRFSFGCLCCSRLLPGAFMYEGVYVSVAIFWLWVIDAVGHAIFWCRLKPCALRWCKVVNVVAINEKSLKRIWGTKSPT